MRLSKLKKIIKILEESNIEEIEIKSFFTKVRVSKKASVGVNINSPNTQTMEIKKNEKIKEENEKFVFIKSPMIGTFYRRPSPNVSPYVEVGDRVEPKKIVCIIEAMKVFNEIEAGVSGIIAEILVENESHVEYAQPLFKVIPQ